MQFPKTPSALWASAAKIRATGPLWDQADTQCIMCGAGIPTGSIGTPADKNLINESFNSKLECRYSGRAVCGHCMALWSNQWLQTDSKSYAVAGEGVFKLARAEDIGRFVIDPPKAPYVAIFNTRQQAHMIWRTPVAMPNPDMLQVRLDDEMIVIDRKRVLAAVQAWQDSRRILAACGRPKGQVYLNSYDLASTMVGQTLGNTAKIVRAHSAEGAAAIDALASLNAADWWALCALRDLPPEDLDPLTSKLPSRRRVEIVAASEPVTE